MREQPADIGGIWLEWYGRNLYECCSKYAFEKCEGALAVISDNAEIRREHYPWVALAVDGYRTAAFDTRSKADVRPTKFANLLGDVAKSARQLDRSLNSLTGAANAALRSGNYPKFRAYNHAYSRIVTAFEWPHERPDAEISKLQTEMIEWQAHLESVAYLASEAQRLLLLDRSARGGEGPRLRGLNSFVYLLGDVWTSMTGKRPSAEPIKGAKNDTPPFVRFVQAVASSADLPKPSTAMVRTALHPH